MVMADVSVVIPTHDRRSLVLRAVRCAVEQRDVAVEVVVVDDGSSDGTGSAIRHEFDDRVTLVRNESPGGVSRARNIGIERSRSDLVAFLDDDDVWAPDKLFSQLDELERTKRGWVYAGMVTVDADLEILHGVRPDPPHVIAGEILIRNRLPSGPSNVVVKRDVLETTGGFDPGMRYHEDWDLWIRLSQLGLPAAVERPLLAHVVHGRNTPVDAVLSDLETVERRYADRRGDRRIDRGEVYRWIASSHLNSGRYLRAAHAYTRAVIHSPRESLALATLALGARDIGPGTAFRRPPDPDWREQAESWLAPLRRN
jgi:glycosyltransferase involved in cell wall biosynthesis